MRGAIRLQFYFLIWTWCSALCLGHGEVHEVLRRLDVKLKQNPNSAELYLQRAEFLFKDGNMKAARKDLQKVKNLDPKMFGHLLLSAMIHSSEKHFNAAERELNSYIKYKPHDSQGYLLRCKLMESLGRRLEAETDLKEAIRRHHAPLTLYHQLIRWQLRRSGFTDAMTTYAEAEKKLGEIPALLASKVKTLAKYGKPSEAVLVYAQLRKLNPSLSFMWWYEEGVMWRSSKKGRAQARHSFEEAAAAWMQLPKRSQRLPHLIKKYKEALKHSQK